MVTGLRGAGLRLSAILGLSSAIFAASCGDDESQTGGGGEPNAGAPSGAGEAGVGGTSGGGQGGTGASSGAGNTSGAGGAESGAGGDSGAGGGPTSIAIEPESLPSARVGERYTVELNATGSDADDFTWTLVGDLPEGLTFEDGPGTTATIDGTPTAAGTYSFGADVEDSSGSSAEITYPLRVHALPWVLYSVRASSSYAVDVTGGAPATPAPVNATLATGESASLGPAQPDGPMLSYFAESATRLDLWVTNLGGLAPEGAVRVNSPQPNDLVLGVWFSPDGQRLAYTSTESFSSSRSLLFAVDTSGPAPSPPVEASGTLPADGGVQTAWWSGSFLYFEVASATSGPGSTPGNRIYETDVSSFPPATPTPITSWDGQGSFPSPDGRRVAYWRFRTPGATTGPIDMWVVGVQGTVPRQPVRMHSALATDEQPAKSVVWANDASAAYFTVENRTTFDARLVRVAFDADGPLPEEPVSVGSGYIGLYEVSQDGERVVYCQTSAFDADDGTIWVADVSGATPGTPERVNGPLVAGGSVVDENLVPRFGIGPDSRHVVYIADALVNDSWEAFLVDISASPSSPRRLNTTLPSASSAVEQFQFSPDPSVIGLFGDLQTAGRLEYFGVRLENGVPDLPVKLNGTLGTNEQVLPNPIWSPDGSLAAFLINDSVLRTSRAEVGSYDGSDFAAGIRVSAQTHDVNNLRFYPNGF
jgi:hypothetical protein